MRTGWRHIVCSWCFKKKINNDKAKKTGGGCPLRATRGGLTGESTRGWEYLAGSCCCWRYTHRLEWFYILCVICASHAKKTVLKYSFPLCVGFLIKMHGMILKSLIAFPSPPPPTKLDTFSTLAPALPSVIGHVSRPALLWLNDFLFTGVGWSFMFPSAHISASLLFVQKSKRDQWSIEV